MGLTIAEGIETTLSGMQLGWQPAWSVVDAAGIAKFPVLSGIEALTILVDNDASGTGQRRAMECSDRWTKAGREVLRVLPRRSGDDLNDIVRKWAVA
jgi:putative DNA primase/helicase